MPVYDANSDDSPLWQLMVSIHAVLSGMTFDAVGNDVSMSVSTDAIVIRKVGGNDDGYSDALPGIIISPPNQNTTPWEAGTNVEVESTYPVLIQVISPDLGDKIHGMRTLLRWQNDICRRLSAPNLTLVDQSSSGVGFEISQAVSAWNLDAKVWSLHKKFQCGIILQCVVRETWVSE